MKLKQGLQERDLICSVHTSGLSLLLWESTNNGETVHFHIYTFVFFSYHDIY